MKLSISMTRKETLLGWSYLLISIFVLPFILVFFNVFLEKPLSETVINLLFLWINFGVVTIIFHHFLLSSVKTALSAPLRCLRSAALGLGLYFSLSLLIARVIIAFFPDFSNVNDNAIMGLFQEHPAMMAFTTVVLVPITEESLYRGLFFQGLQRKSRILAYYVSTFVFAAIHIAGYIGLYDPITLLLCFVQYLPAGITLALAYENADTIVAPILMHIMINLIGTYVMR